MAGVLETFLLYHLGASLFAGLWATLLVLLLIRLLNIRSAVIRNKLLVLPLFKSLLVLIGLTSITPLFDNLIVGERLPWFWLLPVVLLWAGVGVAFRYWGLRRLTQQVRNNGRLPSTDSMITAKTVAPALYLTETAVSPAILESRSGKIIMPQALATQLDDEELDNVLAHEIAHMIMRRPRTLERPSLRRLLLWASPIGFVIGRLIDNIEEQACDEIAAYVTGTPEALASALLKTYRFRQQQWRLAPADAMARFLGGRSFMKARVKCLLAGLEALQPFSPGRSLAAQLLTIGLLFIAV